MVPAIPEYLLKYMIPVMLVLSACVTKGKYETDLAQLQQALDASQETLSERDATLATLTAERDRLEKQAEQQAAALVKQLELTGDLESEIVEVRAALEALQERADRAQESLNAYKELTERFATLIDAGTLEVTVIDGRMTVQMATDILFPPGSSRLSSDGKEAVFLVGEVLATMSEQDFQVVGHTDDRPIQTERFPSNWHLGASRAISVTQLLIEAGVPSTHVTAASAAEFAPADSNRTPAGRAANRRIEIIVVPDLSDLPGYDELNAITAPTP